MAFLSLSAPLTAQQPTDSDQPVVMRTAAQLSGRFYLAKATFAKGEPVLLYLDLVNQGPGPVDLIIGDPDEPFCSGVSIIVSSDTVPSISCYPSLEDTVCSSYPRTQLRIPPGGTYAPRFLLNFNHDINATGDYSVEAEYMSPAAKTQARLKFRIDAKSITSIDWKPWLEQLRSPRSGERQEAGKTLASLAPLSLEETLLGFANNPEFRKYAPLAFHRLNTPRSIEALVQFMKGPVTSEQIEAAQYLAATNDQKWYPLLREAAEKNARISNYVSYAAELGGDEMLPLLVALEKSPDTKFTHLNAIMAMGSTGSRSAIPILLDQLRSPDVDASDRANNALQLLTHRTALQDSQSGNPQDEYLKWSRWWEREGATAPIYKDSECGQMVPLP